MKLLFAMLLAVTAPLFAQTGPGAKPGDTPKATAPAIQTANPVETPVKRKIRRRKIKTAEVKQNPQSVKKTTSMLYGTMERIETLSALYENLGLRLSTETLKIAFELNKTVGKAAAIRFNISEPGQERENAKSYRSLLEITLRSLRILKEIKNRMTSEEIEPAMTACADLYSALGEELAAPSLISVTTEPKTPKSKDTKSLTGIETPANATDTLFAVSEVTFALQAYNKENGRYPKKLADIVPKYLTALQAVAIADHPKTTEVINIDSRDFDSDISKAMKDTGKWVYFSHKKSVYYGKVFIDCTHKDSQGLEFYRIGEGKE